MALLAPIPARAADPVRVVYIGLQDDPYYAPQIGYTGLSLRDQQRPFDGASLAFRDSRILSRALGISFELDLNLVPTVGLAAEAAQTAWDTGAAAIIIDLPETDMKAVVENSGEHGIVFNIRDRSDKWRGADCAPNLVHAIPSLSMLTDAMAQYLKFKGWDRVLLLHGPEAPDLEETVAVAASARKFGLKVVDQQQFEISNDPRQRDSNNIALLTGNARHDVIWLVDTYGEFGRYVPFATQQPRPVVGSEGLSAVAWHWTSERYGAPQLNQRFRRLAQRDMTSLDWAAWVAFRIVVAAVEQSRTSDRAVLGDAIRNGLAIDLYKGPPGSVRAWDGQLRQPILLATHNAVIATAPLAGFEHQYDTLDTLGPAESESECTRL
ncbi:MAG: ABC transporter substrate-binding protein [Verrucomicrobia bacterium]|nr:ABC transporter substrate-binding protein [Verrucomicrobiota bacterium]